MHLDGSGRRQLTNDGKFKFLPHFSPDGSKIIYTKYEVGGYGDPKHRDPARLAEDIREGYVSEAAADTFYRTSLAAE